MKVLPFHLMYFKQALSDKGARGQIARGPDVRCAPEVMKCLFSDCNNFSYDIMTS